MRIYNYQIGVTFYIIAIKNHVVKITSDFFVVNYDNSYVFIIDKKGSNSYDTLKGD